MSATFEQMLNRNGLEMIGAINGTLREIDEHAETRVAAEYRDEMDAAADYPEVVRISYRYARKHLARSFGIPLEESAEEGEERIAAQLPAIKARAEAERQAAGEEPEETDGDLRHYDKPDASYGPPA